MFRNYLTAAVRNLARNRLYAGINIAGLAVGFAAAILIGLFVRDEFSYDSFIPGHHRVFRVSTNRIVPGRGPMFVPVVPPDLAAWMKLDFPGVQSAARLASEQVGLRHGDFEASEDIAWADPDLFEVLPLQVFAGNLRTALERPDAIVLTRQMARKYFGRDNPIGETIEINRQHSMRVTAVLMDLPSNTHLDARIFASGRAAYSRLAVLDAMPGPAVQKPWNTLTYVRLSPAASIDELAHALPDFIDRHMQFPGAYKVSAAIQLTLIPINAIHLYGPGSTTADYALAAIGALTVLLASLNFVNLTTARATRRAIEVGVRKASGASRTDLVIQFIGESMIYVALSMVLALALVEVSMPYFNAFLGRTILFEYWRSPDLAISIVGAVLLVGTLAGAYPAVVLSAFPPAWVLRSRSGGPSGSQGLRQALVILQFAILIGLTVSTGILYRQTHFATHDSLRFDKDQVLLIRGSCPKAFKDEVRALSGVRSASCSFLAPLLNPVVIPTRLHNGQSLSIHESAIDVGFLELYGFKPLAGRFFSAAHEEDVPPEDSKLPLGLTVVINETARRQLGYASPGDAIGQSVPLNMLRSLDENQVDARPAEIIGVVTDFPMGSIREPIGPTVFYVQPNLFQLMSVKLSGRQIPETLASIDLLWKRLGGSRPVSRFFFDQQVEDTYRDMIRQQQLMTALESVALFIACLGLFGIAAFSSERRTKEIGIRKVMGAETRDIMRMLLWQFSRPVLYGSLIAWPVAAYIMNRWLQSFAYHVPLAPWLFVATTVLTLIIALITVSAHCWPVARAKPAAALRYE
ncbi:MAG TPA: ABC transporter permease [Steroidobacteraceae bacterium]|nr:ABC transporter permease [Steroidobacteraceae bacterium]